MNFTFKSLNKKIVHHQLDLSQGSGQADIVSKLRMPCCNNYIEWNGTGLSGFIRHYSKCLLCGQDLVNYKKPAE